AENPIVNRIAFEGNRRIDDETLGPEVQLKPRQIFTRAAAEKDVKRILEIYRRSGRFAASVEPKVIQLEQNRVDVAFEIVEGEQTLIEKIVFIGNMQFSDSDLIGEISSKEAAWYRFLSNDDVYDPDRVAFDRELLRGFYLSQGYVDFRVNSAVTELTPDRDGFILTFTVEEGPQYSFGAISLDNKLTDIPDFRLSMLLKPRTGEIYNNELIRETVDDLVDEVGTFGFTFVDVRPRSTIRREEKEVDLVFLIDEGPRVYVERIDVEGNLRTLDRVIRREFGIVEGDAFNTSKISRATRRVRNLGYFKKVDVSNEQGSSPDRARVRVEVEETATGEFSIGAGYSSESGALFTLRLAERNLLGKGQELALATSLSENQNEIDLSFTEPYFRDQPVSVGGDIFRVTTEYDDRTTNEEEVIGGRLRIGYRLSEDWFQRWRYTLSRRNTDYDENRTNSRDSSTLLSAVGHEVSYDTRDNRFNPTTGNTLSISNDLAGLGGDARFLRTDARASQYFPMSKRPAVTLALSARAGAIVGLGKDVEGTDRYFLGGRSLRGFESAGAGPRIKEDSERLDSGFATGGNYIATTTAELIFPVGFSSEDLGLQARLFSEFGTLFGVDDIRSEDIHDDSSIRGSLGFGLSWATPLGPLRLDFAWPVVKEDFDQDETILFSIGTQF
ncbi:MAG: outer membrane protein assembly factor BamA, partial [Alphaproteobacteria bacterium]|nr:outer membrane protein assembly factor BamA [Alphaproteobacteria bacterium]